MCTLKKGIYIFFKLNKTDTSLYFLTLEKVAVSLPTKCLSDPTNGSVLIDDYKLGHAPFPGFAYMNRIHKGCLKKIAMETFGEGKIQGVSLLG